MPPSNNASPFPQTPKPTPPTALPVRMPKVRGSIDSQSMTSSISTLPYRASSSSVSSLFASTTTPIGSRSQSPSGTSTPRAMSGSIFGGGTPGEQLPPSERPEDPRNLILQAFVPNIAVFTSTDTKELVRDKGFEGGLWELLRPFGEKVQGKVTVRDSVGAGKTYEDFGVRFVELGDGMVVPESLSARKSLEGKSNGSKSLPEAVVKQRERTGGSIEPIESLVDRHLSFAEGEPSQSSSEDYLGFMAAMRSPDIPSPFYTLYLRRLLSGIPLAPHETFSHPVACVIAISSRNTNPIETLRNLYDESSHGEKRLPLWVNNEYLRYYVLVHDEERDDITKSLTLFEQMKRHFGLHCHLLRLRSSNCVATDDDSVILPQPEWVAAPEELAKIRTSELLQEDLEDSFRYIYESDTTAIKTFIREMVTQSIVPSMERCVATWNDQVASRRRGLGGRFMSITKKWAFGSSSRNSLGNGPTGSSSNYDNLQGFYRPDAPEAIMRKLADYAFMLRDWKLAQSTYDLLRSDFNNDKAWRYHAAANEMAALSTLMTPQAISSKSRSETIDQMLETASYSYITRCGQSYGALRCLALGMELLRLRGGSATEDAARWGLKLIEYKVLGHIGEALIKERISACYASKKGSGTLNWGARTRKSALMSLQAADAWLTLGKPHQANQKLLDAKTKYEQLMYGSKELKGWKYASEWLEALRREVELAMYEGGPDSAVEGPSGIEELLGLGIEGGVDEVQVDVDEEEMVGGRRHRRSLMGERAPGLGLGLGGFGSQPLNGEEEGVGGGGGGVGFE